MSEQKQIELEFIKNRMKNPVFAVVLNFILAGAGFFYTGDNLKAVIVIVISMVCLFTSFLVIPGLIYLGVWVWAMVSGYKRVVELNEELLKNSA